MQRIVTRRLYNATAVAAPAAPRRPAPTLSTPSHENARQKAVIETPDGYDPMLAVFKKARSEFRESRKGPYLHVSDLIHRCMRARALQARFNMEPPPQQLTISDQFTFAQGDAIHDKAKEIMARNAPDKTWGRWHCRCKYLRHDEPATLSEIEPETCPYCGTLVNVYEEVPVFSEKYGVVGNPDLMFYEQDWEAFHVNELKSIAAGQFGDLSRPLPDHVLQVVAYWQLLKWKGFRLTDKVTISYISKGWVFGSTLEGLVKSFTFKVARELPRLQELWDAALSYKAIRDNPAGPMPIRICETRNDTEAKKCNVCQICFSGAAA